MRLIRRDLEDLPFDEKTLRSVEDLIAFLSTESAQVRLHRRGFLHAKCWFFYSDRPGQQMLFDRFRPVAAIVGSSNFTTAGLTSNRELNLTHKLLLDPGEATDPDAQAAVGWLTEDKPSTATKELNRQLIKSEVGARAIIELGEWFEGRWADAIDFKQSLIELLDASKFGRKEYTPYQLYMKALFEYFKGDLETEDTRATRSAVDLAEFQEDAVKKARKVLARYDGVMVADSVGLGKTWIGKKLLEDYAYHLRQQALVVCPASLRDMLKKELQDTSIAATILSQEELGQEGFNASPYADADIVLVDESHNFRNRNAQRYGNLEGLLGGNGGKGRNGSRKKLILLTATPINNDLLDLYNQIALVTMGDRGYFSPCGIGDLHRYFLQARRDFRNNNRGQAIFNLLEEIVIRRTRPFIRMAYPNATIGGKKITFPERKLRTVNYNLESAYPGIYGQVVAGIENLLLAPYTLETYKKAGVEVDEFEAGREQALVGIFKSRYLKRFESSVHAFRISVHRALSFFKTFESYLLDGKLIRSTDFHKALRFVQKEDEEDDATPKSLADQMDDSAEAKQALENVESIDPGNYDLRRLHDALQHDVELLSNRWNLVKNVGPDQDVKLERLKELLSGDLSGKKVLIFSYFKDTARYLYQHLGHPDNAAAQEFIKQLGGIHIRRMDSDASPKDRTRIVQGFAPKANKKTEWLGTEKEIEVLVSTDVLSEGQNLQDCGYIVNYDLHWNPTRMVQRAGRIDRIGTEFDTLWIYNMFPDEGLERLLGLVESLNRKIADIDQAGFLDASVLGEAVHPRNFNTLRRIRDEDGSVIEEEEQFTELVSNEFLAQQLRQLLDAGGREMLDSLPDGIHSGLLRPRARGVFFYFQATPKGSDTLHFWRYLDLQDGKVMDNRYIIANLIACDRDSPRVVEPEIFGAIFDHQETVIEYILRSYREQEAIKVAPRTVEPIQQTVATLFQNYMNHPDVERPRVIAAIKSLSGPMLAVQVKDLRKTFKQFQADEDITRLLEDVERISSDTGVTDQSPPSGVAPAKMIERDDLRLICFDVISG
jgi:superfamily II DNA or RNA helicase